VPRLSVLLPVREAAASLDACLDSLVAQTLADHEVVAVDDGSRDGSGELLRARARSDPRLRGPLHLAAVGQPGARERIRAVAARLGLVEGADLVAVA